MDQIPVPTDGQRHLAVLELAQKLQIPVFGREASDHNPFQNAASGVPYRQNRSPGPGRVEWQWGESQSIGQNLFFPALHDQFAINHGLDQRQTVLKAFLHGRVKILTLTGIGQQQRTPPHPQG